MKKRIASKIVLLNWAAILVVAAAGSCVKDRATRTELFTENVYLDKQFLTRENPNNPGKDDLGWLYNVTVTATSTPNPLGDTLFPGMDLWPSLGYVRFKLTPESTQMVNGIDIMNGDFPDVVPRVLTEWPGGHVDLQLRQNLDGEKTNYEEENRERPWQDRQYFKVNFSQAKLEDTHTLAWWAKYYVDECADLKSVALVPDSFGYVDSVREESNMCPKDDKACAVDFAKGDYFEWTVEATYQMNPLGACQDLMCWRTDTATATVDFKYSFWRPPAPPAGKEFVEREIKEKDKYRKTFGIFDALQVYTDPATGLTGATFKMARFNTKLEHTWYFAEGFPEKYKDEFALIEEDTNAVMEKAGVDFRVRFKEFDDGGVVRRPGDVRYSFVDLHRNQYTTFGLLGYGPPHIDPRTGEIVSAATNLYDFGLQYYTFLIRDLLEQVSDAFDDLQEDPIPLPEPCTPGDIRPLMTDRVREKLQNTTFYSKMVEYMKAQPDEWLPEHSEKWRSYYHMMMNDFRFAVPWWNTFVYGEEGPSPRYERMVKTEGDFRAMLDKINHGENPVGINDATAPGYIEKAIDTIAATKEGMANHFDLQMEKEIARGARWIDVVDGPSLLEAVPKASRMCKDDETWETFAEWEDRIISGIVHQVGIHELGHNLSLRHNFFGSVDAPNMPEGAPSSSVMDYVNHIAEAGAPHTWWNYDVGALVYEMRYDTQAAVDEETDEEILSIIRPEGTGTKLGVDFFPEKQYLYCTDEHRYFSPLCRAFDLGVTPSEIVLEMIQRYDWQYRIRNFRSFRQFWDTWDYPNRVLSYIFPMRRFLEMWALDWDSASIENDLRIMGVTGDAFFFQNITQEFAEEMGQANRLAMNFFKSILQQSSGERSYATTYDSFFGDITRQGIIYDKYFAMLTFLGLWPADSYNQDMYAYLAYYESSWGNAQYYSDAMDVLDSMLGGQYDVYPWFLPLAVLVFAMDTHDINFGDQTMKEWIGFRSFADAERMIEYFDGLDPRVEALGAADDGHHVFHDKRGNRWIYVYLADRNVHVMSSYDQSPASFQLIWDYNEYVFINRYDWATTYDIKYWLDYYNYFN